MRASKTATARPGRVGLIGRYQVRLSAWMRIVVNSAVLLKGIPLLGSAVADLTERGVKEELDRAVDRTYEVHIEPLGNNAKFLTEVGDDQ
jgi:hypothetical protein